MAKIFLQSQLKSLEKKFIEDRQLSEFDLIYRAGTAVAEFLDAKFEASKFIFLCGNGNNGADGLIAAKWLFEKGRQVEIILIRTSSNDSPEFKLCLDSLPIGISLLVIEHCYTFKLNIEINDVLVEALLGSGQNRSLDVELEDFIQKLNTLNVPKISLDVPIGLKSDGELLPIHFNAHLTIGLGSLKLAYFLPLESDPIGNLNFIELGFPVELLESKYRTIDLSLAKSIMRIRPKNTHKYLQGSTLLIGGSYGMCGCMKLAGEAALRAGAGLVTLHVPSASVNFLQSALPEAILQPDENQYHVGYLEDYTKFNAIGIGPGMSVKTKQINLIQQLFGIDQSIPLVIDADALTLLSMNPDLLNQLPKNSILTPHTGEFKRLFGSWNSAIELMNIGIDRSVSLNTTIVLKSHHTMIFCPSGMVYFNTTGNPGMATAGSGDVLTGILTGLLAQGYSTLDAALLGVYLHGLAGDMAADQLGHESLIASDIIQHIGFAYKAIRSNA